MFSFLRAITRPTTSLTPPFISRAAFPGSGSHPCRASPAFTTNTFHPSAPVPRVLNQARCKPPPKKASSNAPLLDNNPQRKGIVMQAFITKPKKPNSARRKVARARLTSGKVPQAYIPGKGHNLQEHSVVLVRGGRAQDLPGVQRAALDTSRSSPSLTERLVSYSYKPAPGASDLGGVANRVTSRSRYGGKHPIQLSSDWKVSTLSNLAKRPKS